MPDVIRLWPDGAPGSEDRRLQERDYWFAEPWKHRVTRNVTDPSLTVFLPTPAAATGTGVIICPGGAHHFLAVDHEGNDVAKWLTERGIAAFVLKYRVIETPRDDADFLQERSRIGEPGRLRSLLGTHWPLALADGQQAVRTIRSLQTEWELDTSRIGIMGLSAGGHVAVGVALEGDGESRVDFVAPIYGALWEHVAVPQDAQSLFLALASDDPIAVGPWLDLYRAWHDAGRPAELHLYARGGYGFGMVRQGLPSDGWIERFYEWLKSQGFVGHVY